uniref:Family with sequence similarity 13 member C n=1 Tax=Lepisosteus oculatus TaxID=7918 RepID=W5MHS0_LEPOC
MGTSASFTLCNSVSSVNIKKCNAKINPESSHKHPLSQIFGAPLETLREAGLMVCGVPLVLHNMVEYLDHYGVQQKGLFRVSGSVTKVNLLKTKYDAGEAVDLQMEGDAQCVASLMKLFLRELPTSLIPAVLHTDLITAFRESKDEAELNHLLKKQLDSLPADHYSLLSYLTHFLLRVAAHSQDNQMTAENLATVFGPCIFQVPVGPNMLRDQFVCNAIVRHLLKNREVLLRAGWEATPPALQPAHAATEALKTQHVQHHIWYSKIKNSRLNLEHFLICSWVLGKGRTRVFCSSEFSQITVQPRLPLHFAVCSNSLTIIGIVLMNCVAEEWSEKKQNTGVINDFICRLTNFNISNNLMKLSLVQVSMCGFLFAFESNSVSKTERFEFLSKSRSHSDETQSALKQKFLYLKFRDVSMFLTNEYNRIQILAYMTRLFFKLRMRSILNLYKKHSYNMCSLTDRDIPPVNVVSGTFKFQVLKQGRFKVDINSSQLYYTTLRHIYSSQRSESSFLKLQALDVDLCSAFVPSQEDSAQIQGNKEQSLPTARSVQAETIIIFPVSDVMFFNCGRELAEPVPALRILHHERESSAESQQAPGPSRLLHYITDGDSPLPSPRCPSFSQSQRFNSDPESAPSPPSAQQFIMSRGIVRTVPSEGSKEPLSVALLTKHIQNLKKKIKKFEERFEQERKYRPSHNDKTANPEMFKLMDDLAKSRKQLKDLKLKQSVVELRERRTDSQTEMSRVSSDPQGGAEQQHKPCLEETVDTLLKRLKEKRSTLGLPENMKEMNQNQMALEKVTLQKCLLYFESLHGRPVTKQERNLMKPLYDRYRAIKQLLCSTPSITTIPQVRLHFHLLWQQLGDHHCHLHNLFKHIHEEEDSDDDNMPHSPAPPSRALCQISTDESLCPQDEDNETAFVSPLDEVKAVRQPAITMSNLHEASKPELLEYLRETRAEKHRLRRALREFEDQFFKQMGRAAQKEDRIPMAEEYYEYKNIKAKLRLLEVLLSKQEASKTI